MPKHGTKGKLHMPFKKGAKATKKRKGKKGNPFKKGGKK